MSTRHWLITAESREGGLLMAEYESMSREKAVQEFVRNNFPTGREFALRLHAVGPAERIEGSYELKLNIGAKR